MSVILADAVTLAPADLVLLSLLADGLPMEAAARRLEVSERTIRRRMRTICDQLDVRFPIQAIVWAARRGLL